MKASLVNRVAWALHIRIALIEGTSLHCYRAFVASAQMANIILSVTSDSGRAVRFWDGGARFREDTRRPSRATASDDGSSLIDTIGFRGRYGVIFIASLSGWPTTTVAPGTLVRERGERQPTGALLSRVLRPRGSKSSGRGFLT